MTGINLEKGNKNGEYKEIKRKVDKLITEYGMSLRLGEKKRVPSLLVL